MNSKLQYGIVTVEKGVPCWVDVKKSRKVITAHMSLTSNPSKNMLDFIEVTKLTLPFQTLGWLGTLSFVIRKQVLSVTCQSVFALKEDAEQFENCFGALYSSMLSFEWREPCFEPSIRLTSYFYNG